MAAEIIDIEPGNCVINTFTGGLFYPLAPRAGDVHIKDIAHHLSMRCRWSGALKDFYSIAQHSLEVSEILRKQKHSLEVQMWGLLHDAGEAYLADVPSPIKQAPEFAAFREAELRLMSVIAERFGLEWPEPEAVGEADRLMARVEAVDLTTWDIELSPRDRALFKKPSRPMLFAYEQGFAKNTFLSHFRSLSRALGRADG